MDAMDILRNFRGAAERGTLYAKDSIVLDQSGRYWLCVLSEDAEAAEKDLGTPHWIPISKTADVTAGKYDAGATAAPAGGEAKTPFVKRATVKKVFDAIYAALSSFRDKQKGLEARIVALEAVAGAKAAGGEGRILRSLDPPHEASQHAVGDIVRVAGSGDWRCVAPNRWRLNS